MYTIYDKPGICFALTRYLPYQKCSSEKFARCWSDNRKTAATAFLEQVFAVALEAIENGYYHWDIRPSNLLFKKMKENEIEFYILDWDSLSKVRDAKQLSAAAEHHTTRVKISTSPALFTLAAELSLCERLLFQCVFQWDNINISERAAEFLASIFKRSFPSDVLTAKRTQSETRRKYFVRLMKLFLGLVCLVY